MRAIFSARHGFPGYRPGKAPQALVESRFAKDIKEELTSKLLRESLNEAIREKNLRVLSVSQVENVEIADDRTMRYRATVVTAPEFELPDYSFIPAEIAREEVTDESVQTVDGSASRTACNLHAGRRAPAGDGRLCGSSPTAATFDGKPLGEAIPEAPAQLQGRRNAWILMDEALASAGILPGDCRDECQRGKDHFRSIFPRTFLLPSSPARQSITR